ncbi:MAG: carbohydrate-binding domain-containing protein [Lachnospiraceae bacterium]|nr:carbohydrate-binding domain-containing protein [Lachnospiraceae bacterium]
MGIKEMVWNKLNQLSSIVLVSVMLIASLTACGNDSNVVNGNGANNVDGAVEAGGAAAGSTGSGNGSDSNGSGEMGSENGGVIGEQGTGSSNSGSVLDQDIASDNGMGGAEAGNNDGQSQQAEAAWANAEAVNVLAVEELFTERDLEGAYGAGDAVRITLEDGKARSDSNAVEIWENRITITKEGTYVFSGNLQEGMIEIAAGDGDKVQLVLDNASISNSTNGALYVKNADKVFVTLAEGTVNSLKNTGSYEDSEDSKVDGVIFSKTDLTINGMGSLEITAEEGHGIVSKDDLKITGGNLSVKAAGHGLSGKDSVRIANGAISIVSGKDGIHSEHDTNEEKGYVYIKDGEFTMDAGGDGISASGCLQIDGGSFAITSGGGSANKTAAKDENGHAVSTKGIKASGPLVVNGGQFIIDAQDDGIHSNGNLTINGGEYQVATGDDGFHGDEKVQIAGGSIAISQSYEGIEGRDVVISGGNISLYASDDGLNAAGGNDNSGFGGAFGRDSFGDGGNASLLISGGILYIHADGDGIDSNGDLTVTGGEVYISGPEDNANGALDYDGVGEITGGVVVALGSSGMAMNFGDTSTQGAILINTADEKAGAKIIVKDQNGEEIITYTAEKAFQSVMVSSPELVLGGTYTILAGNSKQSVTLKSLIYGSGMERVRPGMGGGHVGRGDRGDTPRVPGDMEAIPDVPDAMEDLPDVSGSKSGMSDMPDSWGDQSNMSGMPDSFGNRGELPDGPGEMGALPEFPENMGDLSNGPGEIEEVPSIPGGLDKIPEITDGKGNRGL